MSLVDLCRLCVVNVNCSTIGGIFVYSDDSRREKIRDCLSFIVKPLSFKNSNIF